MPVVQLSINALQPLAYHLDIGTQLAPLREHGVVVAASGNVVHNLGRIAWDRREDAFDWNRRFDVAVTAHPQHAPEDVLQLVEHPDYEFAVPTPDHFVSLLYLAGIAAASGTRPDVLVDGYAYGSLSMTCHTIGVTPPASRLEPSTAALPEPAVARPEQANV